MAQLVPLQESYAHNLSDIFLSMVVNQHGLPECIISDYDPHFYNYFWDELISLLDRTLTLSMALYP